MNKKSLLFCFLIFLSFSNLFGQINVISPIPGKWANKQILYIQTDPFEKADYFYSVDGSSPKEFGFAYDGPVLLDTEGKVTLKIAKVTENNIEEQRVDFEIEQNDGFNTSYEDLITSFYSSGLLNYSAGAVISIPSELSYRFGSQNKSFLQGQELSLSKNTTLSRYLPCELYDSSKNLKWRFIIKTIPQSLGIYSKRDLPFYVTDWNTITFSNQDYIYKIDDGMWNLPKEPVFLDRNENHIIYWQSINYEQGNPVEYFALPKKPELQIQVSQTGAYTYSLIGDDSYTLAIKNDDSIEINQLFTEIGIDTFVGDKISGNLQLQAYSNSIYQGDFFQSYEVDKSLPEKPEISSNVNSFYTRQKVDVVISGDESSDLYVSISKPFTLEEIDKNYLKDDDLFNSVQFEEFIKVPNNHKISFIPKSENVEFYKIKAYSYNGKNKSDVSEYSVIIDMYNYYFDSESTVENPDGTLSKPFSNFEQSLETLNKSRSVVLRVKGDLLMPPKKVILNANCLIKNDNNAVLVFPANSSLIVKNSSLEINDCRIKTDEASLHNEKQMIPIIKMENGVLTLSNCEIVTSFLKNGTVFDSFNSVVNMNNVIVSARSNSYISLLSAVKSRINIKKSTLACDSETAILFSVNDSIFECQTNTLRVIGKRGRVAEFFNSQANVINNLIQCELQNQNPNNEPFYYNKESKVELSGNDIY